MIYIIDIRSSSCLRKQSFLAKVRWLVKSLWIFELELILEGDSLSFQVKTFPTGFTRLHRLSLNTTLDKSHIPG